MPTPPPKSSNHPQERSPALRVRAVRSTCGRKLSIVSAPATKPKTVTFLLRFVQLLYKLRLGAMASLAQERSRDSLGALVLQLHMRGGIASRAELTEVLGCGRSAMGYLLGELTSRGLVSIDPTGGPAPST